MDKHRQEKKKPEFGMVAVNFFRSAFIRQLSEAVRLSRRRTQQPNIEILNSLAKVGSKKPRCNVKKVGKVILEVEDYSSIFKWSSLFHF